MKKSNLILSVKNLSYKKILKDVSFDVKEGNFISISGSNICGKTTLIKILSGLIQTENMVYFNGKELESINKTDLFSKIGIVLINDKFNFLFDNVKDEVMFVLNNLNMSDEERKDQYDFIIKLLGLTKYQKFNPNYLNRSEKILVLLALAVVHKPKLLFLDDASNMMSKEERKKFLEILHFFNKEFGTTIIMSTSKLDETLDTDYLYLFDEGTIALSGKPLDILKDDNVINKLGLNMPFMLDLSIKLKDYDLIKETVLDMEGMVDLLWK